MLTRSLSPVAVLVLSSLAEAPPHGYSPKKDVKDRSGGDGSSGATSLYRTVWQLLDLGLIAECRERPAPEHDDSRRRYFQITTTGRRTLAAELSRLERVGGAGRPRRYASKSRP